MAQQEEIVLWIDQRWKRAIFPVGIVISFSWTAVQYIRDCRGVPTEYGDCCYPNSSQ